MTIDPEIREIGEQLHRHAQEVAEFSAQRGIVSELFPYIHAASKRMSTRAISRWLLDTHKIKLSAVTIAKALREPGKHWQELVEEVEPLARVVAQAHRLTLRQVLTDGALFDGLHGRPPSVSGKAGLEQYDGAYAALRKRWFGVLDEEAIETCAALVEESEREPVQEESGKCK